MTKNLSLGAAVAVTDAELTETADLGPAGFAREGAELLNVPFFSYNTFASYDFKMPFLAPDMTGFVRVDVTGSDNRFFDIENRFEEDPYVVVDFRTGLETDRYKLDFFINNLNDERYNEFGLFGNVRPADPREFGVTAAIYF